ncbi:sacsin N-terminal ATP-binding-like domain-containing protein [uncultured Pseudokineococcus sp.]|uniref:sacsin N-terminal ATP-binding-like domain-containing protein n=1 Tax=uncultured Pseudokineococcus sp. TaxID=1642928 RepID=UPI00262FB337|nr:hypothetical protein [uncultured Pseudokineococcus sp.]
MGSPGSSDDAGPSDDAGRPEGSGPEGDPGPAERDDPFGCARLRSRTLAAWTASPDRLREDANAEEELALGGYRDRVVVELAQNAADAAVRGGEAGRGRLLLRLSSADGAPVLLAASGGVPLDAAGVRALAGLRASTKRPEPGAGDGPPPDGVVGRFGVGFTAVLGVSDAPALLTAAGGVGFDRRRADAAVHGAASAAGGELAAEVARRGGSLPVLRTPFAVGPDDVPGGDEAAALLDRGWSTVVVLPLRPDAVAPVGALLDAVDDLLLLALPALGEVRVERPGVADRVLRDVADRWVVLRRSGTHKAAALAGRPAEERADPRWALAWALPRRPPAPSDPLAAALGRLDGGAGPAVGAGVLLAPTPTDEPLPWPAVFVAGLPLEPTRRHVEPGPAAEAVLAAAGAAYADLLALVAAERADAGGGRAGEGDDVAEPPRPAEDPADRPGRADEPPAPPELPDPLDLVPVGPSAGWVDAALRRALERVLPDVPLLAPAAGGTRLLPGARALALEDGGVEPDAAALAALAVAEPALVASPRRHREALTAMGVGRLPLADLVDGWPLPAPGEDLTGAGEAGLAEPTAEDGQGGGLPGWRAVAGALAPLALDQRAREALSALPVPLVGGRWARGCRGALLAGPAVDALAGPEPADRAVGALLVEHGLRLVDPRAAEDRAAAALLERLGAAPAGARTLLDDPATGSAVLAVADALAEDDLDALVLGLGLADEEHDGDGGGPGDADPDDVVDALADVVLGWLADDLPDDAPGDGPRDGGADPWPVGVVAGARAWLLDLPLRDDGDELAPAASLVVPGSPAEAALDPEEVAPVATDLLDRWPAAVLAAAGVTASAGLLVWDDVDLDDPPGALADAAPEWLDLVLDALDGAGGWVADEVALVRDLDLVVGPAVGAAVGPGDVPLDAADGVVALLAAALGDPCAGGRLHPRLRLRGPAGETLEVPSPTAVAVGTALVGDRSATSDGRAPGPTAAPDADPALRALLAPASGAARALPPAWGAAAGVARDWADLGDLRAWAAVLDPLGDPAPADLLTAWAALAHRVGHGPPLEGASDDLERLAAVDGGRAVRRPAEDVVVVDDPLRAAHPACGPALVVPRGGAEAVADALGLGLATEEVPGRVDGDGRAVPLPDDVRALLRLAGGPGVERVRLALHDRLVVDGEAVDAWLEDADGAVTAHAVDARGAGRVLALAAGAWGARSALAEALLAAGLPAPVGSPEPWTLLVDVALDGPGA